MRISFGLCVALVLACVGRAEAVQIMQSFDVDPLWTGSNNTSGGNNFGFSNTANAGGPAGEIGGTVDRFNGTTYYADTTSLASGLNATNAISASGSFIFADNGGGAPNQDIHLGHFDKDKVDSRNSILALRVREPSSGANFRVDFLFRLNINEDGDTADPGEYENAINPQNLAPNVVHTFSYSYDPDLGTFGRITTILNGGTPVTFDLPAARTMDFDSFGLAARNRGVDVTPGANDYNFFADGLEYTAVPEPSAFVLAGFGLAAFGLLRRRK